MPSLTTRRSALAGIALVALLAGTASEAAGARTERRPARPVAKAVAALQAAPLSPQPAAEPATAWTAGDRTGRPCSRIRRKLWQPGEGWVVKAVSVCP